MIDHVWTVLCSNVVTDKETNNLSLIETVEQWNISTDAEFPLVIGNPIILATLWSRSDLDTPTKGMAKISLIAPSGKVRELPLFEVDLSIHRRLRGRHQFQGIEVEESGKYLFRLELVDDGGGGGPTLVAEIPLEINIRKVTSSEEGG